SGFKFSNYAKAFEIAPIGQFYVNSLITAIGGTLLNLFVMGLAAYAVARFEFRGKNFFKLLLSSVLFIPCAALLYPLYVTLSRLGLKDTYAGLFLVYSGLGMATTFYIIMSYTLTIPKELEEAAYIDGAGVLKTYFKIIFPVTKPCFASAAVLEFLLCWNEFQFALTLTTGNKVRTLPIALYYFTSQFSSDYGAMMAATVLVALPSIIFYILLQKQVVSGLVSGSVKG
ncbi:MAG: carbohydrate ABC transporter permease, partial [Acetivibrio sp.]